MTSLVTAPDSPLARAADALAVRVEPPFLVHHSRRTFQLAAHLLASAGRSYDAELLYVGALLHDVTLGTELDDGTTPFHLRAAGIAAQQVVEHGRAGEDATTVYDSIARHLDLLTADHDQPEIAGVHLGAVADVLGLRLDEVPPDLVDAIVAAHPRLDEQATLLALVRAEATTKPWSDMARLVRDVALLDLIAAGPFG